MPTLTLSQFNQGGIADSKVSGIPNSLYRIVGFNLHAEPGIVKVNQKLTTYSVINEYCKVSIPCSNGKAYLCSSETGKVWEVTPGSSTPTLVYTVAPTTGGAAILGGQEYQGYIYLFTENWIHRIPTTGLTDWATNAVPNWNAFLNGDSTYHPSIEQNLVLYIGDGNVVAQVDHESPSDIFSNSALDLAEPNRVSALAKFGTDLLVGTFIAENVNASAVYRWNTWGESYDNQAPINEPGINAFISNENSTIVSAGRSGSLYFYNGGSMAFMRKIRGSYDVDNTGLVNCNATAIFNGNLSLLGVSNLTGSPTDAGVYSFGRYSPSYRSILTLEYPLALVDNDGYPRVAGQIEIGSVLVMGLDLIVSWRYTNGATVTSGVDYLDYTTKIAKPFLETRTIIPNRKYKTSFTKLSVTYVEKPALTDFSLLYSKNFSTTFAEFNTDQRDDVDNQIFSSINTVDANVLQVRLEAFSSGNDAPSFQDILIDGGGGA